MAELNFNALASPGPRGFYQGFEQGQKEKVASEMNQIKLEELRRDRDEMVQLQEKLKGLGQDPDVSKFLDTLAQTGKPEYVKMAIEGKQKIKDLDAYAKLGAIEPVTAAPAMPTGAPALGAPALRMPQAPAPTNMLGSGTFGMGAEPAAAAPVNAMAPAPVNALAAQPGADLIAPTQQRIKQLLDFARINPRMAAQAMAEARILQDQLELYSKRGQNEPPDAVMMRQLGYPLTQAGYQAFRDAQRQERMLSPAEEAQRVRIATASRPPRPETAPRTQQVTLNDGSLGIMNMDTGTVTPATVGGVAVKGKPSAFAEKTAAQKVQTGKDINQAIFELKNVAKEGGLIDQSTGSGAGKLIDIAAGFGGKAMPGAIAAGQLAPIADLVLKMVPRFEGPQSDKDTQSYKAAAGQLADTSLPTKIRKAAANEIIRLMENRKNQFGTVDVNAASSIAPPAGFTQD